MKTPEAPLSFNCPIEAALEALSGKWKPLIVFHLHVEPKRFGELRRAIPGASEKVLIEQLRQLERSGVVNRQIVETVPPQVTYALTEHGHELKAATVNICAWGKKHAQKLGAKITLGVKQPAVPEPAPIEGSEQLSTKDLGEKQPIQLSAEVTEPGLHGGARHTLELSR